MKIKKRANRIHLTSSGPRTGSTLLAEVMKVCFDIDCSCEHEAPISASNTSFGECRNILTKLPSSTRHLEKVVNWDPNLYVICIIRDPRDMVSSFHGKIKDKYYCDLNFWFDFLKNYEKLINNDRVLFIKYEEFTTNPDVIQAKILNKLPFLEKKHDFSDFHLYATPTKDSISALKKLRPIESKGIGNWKNHLPRIKQQLSLHGDISESLIKFDYEKDANWLKLFKNVHVQNFESYKNNKSKSWGGIKSLILTYLNITLEKRGLNPDKILMPFKKVI